MKVLTTTNLECEPYFGTGARQGANDAVRVRFRFAKCGELRLVSHHDLMRTLERTLRRAELPIAHTQGFNPRPKATFALALALGIEGRNEILDLEFTEAIDPAEALRRLQAESPPGFDFLTAEGLPSVAASARSARVTSAFFRLAIPEDRRDQARAAVADLLSRETRPYTRHRPDRTVEVDLRPFVLAAAISELSGDLEFRLKIIAEGSARPEEVIDVLGLKDLLSQGAILVREDLEVA
jgi:radical SAM-linked protein